MKRQLFFSIFQGVLADVADDEFAATSLDLFRKRKAETAGPACDDCNGSIA